jgi:hypothetical protein
MAGRVPKQFVVTAIQHRPGGNRLMARDDEGLIWRSARPQSWISHQKIKGCTVFIRKMSGGDWIACTCTAKLSQAPNVQIVEFPMADKDPYWGR